ncbi:peptidase [Natrialbaceae archaeon A-arb3/5]
MSLLAAAIFWISLVVAVGIGTVVAALVGSQYGRLARGWDDEAAVRWTNGVAIGSAGVAGIGVWALVDMGAALGDPIVPGGTLVSGIAGVVAGSLAAGLVGAGAIGGTLRTYPDLPNAGDPDATSRQYARYLTVVFAAVLGIVSVVSPALQAGPLAFAVTLVVVFVGVWALGPILTSLTSGTRRPTDDERERLERLLETAVVDVRGVRVVDDEDRVSVELSGAPGGRFLFASTGALSALSDETLAAMLVASREQAARFQQLVAGLPVIGGVAVLAAALLGDLSVGLGLVLAAVVVLGGFAFSRRLRLRADDRAAARVGAAELADAYERTCEAAGVDLETDGGRTLLATKPPITARIKRLRRQAGNAT